MAIRNVISTLNADGTEVMGPGVLMYHHPGNDIMTGSLLTVESNHFCVLKSRGAIFNVYEGGQYPVQTTDRPIMGSIQQAFYSGQSPWQYEALFVSAAKSVAKAQGLALSKEMAELVYDVDYYVHVDTKEDAIKLVTHMPYQGHFLTTEGLNNYAGPVLEQAVNQIVQLTPLEQINERIHEITELVRGHLQDFLTIYGITLNDVKVLIRPRDERMRELISLRAFGLSELEAVRYYVAMKMAERGLVSAPNMAVGEPFNIGITSVSGPLPGMPQLGDAHPATVTPPVRG
ncbi:MAG TPA: SPFH domain-containing protein [Streptosporangiaceae bacterium]|jgi:membrane protease subunit (stomatin/prohibitin family)|nr:SPFH domain-containing protein [Streptosporangiaceae bacterium]